MMVFVQHTCGYMKQHLLIILCLQPSSTKEDVDKRLRGIRFGHLLKLRFAESSFDSIDALIDMDDSEQSSICLDPDNIMREFVLSSTEKIKAISAGFIPLVINGLANDMKKDLSTGLISSKLCCPLIVVS